MQNKAKLIGLASGPLVFLLMLVIGGPDSLSPAAWKVIACATWMVIWWMTEALHIAVTAMLPLVLFPFLGIMDMKEASAPYSNPIVFLFMGGFLLALGLEKHNLHRRIALGIITLTGTKPAQLTLGFMLATAFLSMWVSNTATTVMMLPIATSVIALMIREQVDNKAEKNFAVGLLLAIAYSANIGGTATLIGTPPNTVMAGFLKKEYAIDVSFGDWFQFGWMFAAVMLFITWLLLTQVLFPTKGASLDATPGLIRKQLRELGRVSTNEILVFVVFSLTAIAWIIRPTLGRWFPGAEITDAGIAMAGGVLTFLIPTDWKKGDFLLEWKDTLRMPWGILILFGGGLSLAGAMSSTGIIDSIGTLVSSAGWGYFLILTVFVFVVLFMTELMSNVALISIFLPVLAGVALGMDENILSFVIPATLASSCAFMLPMATPPNAIVFASGHLKISQMAKAGIVLNTVAVIIITIMAQSLIPWAFGL